MQGIRKKSTNKAAMPEEWKYEVPKDKKKQLDLLCRLMKDKRVETK